MEASDKAYKKRQAIVEHPYGTIKRQWGFSYIITKRGMERAEADFGWALSAYNLRRIINIIGVNDVKNRLKALVLFETTENARIAVQNLLIRALIRDSIINANLDKAA